MSTRSQLTKDLNESVKALLGKQVKILFKNVVRLETKGDKTENRVLVFSPCRILLLTAKVPSRIDTHFHYLEIQTLESKRGNQLSITANDKHYSFQTGADSACSQDVDSMISALATAIRNIFPTVPLQYIIRKIEVIPSSRLQVLRDIEAVGSNVREVGPCGGFSTQYACMCDYHNMPYREEVAWDVDNIYVSLNTRELCLKDFDHLDQKDLIPIISALEYNTWFTRFRANHVRLSHDVTERVLQVLRRSLSLEALHLDNLALKADFITKLSNALKLNAIIPLHTIDLSNNVIEDKGAINLANCILRLNKGLVHLNLSHCGLTAKGVNQLAQIFAGKSSLYNTLYFLNLSGNNLKDDISNLHTFFSHPNALTHIDISSTDIILENLFGALMKGCTTNLVHLNVSRNPFSAKKNKEAPISFKQFFSTTMNLKYLNMAHCKLPQEALKNLLLGLACNEFTKDITLDLSCNSLGSQGAHVIESCIHGVRCISSLDISENNMDVDLAAVITAISRNRSLRHLHLGRNLHAMKAKHIATVMDALVAVIQDEDCQLQSLFLPDCKLRSDLHNFLNALGDNRCLETIDISGNLIGDSGARLLAKALQINGRLKTIYYDRNGITLQGYHDLAYALESNHTVQYMPFPIFDITPCMKQAAGAERADIVTRKIQELLNRNVSPRKGNQRRTQALQPGFLLSSKQHAVDRLVHQTQDVVKNSPPESIATTNDVNHALGIIEDAENCKQLFGKLQEVAQQKDEKHPVKKKLQESAADIHGAINDYLQVTTDKMLKSSKELCPYVLQDNHVLQDIKKDCKNKKQIPLEFVLSCVKHQAGTDIMNKLGELNLMIASYISEQITDEVFESLMRSYKILLGDDSVLRIESPPRRSRLSSSDSSKHGTSDISIGDISHQSDHSPMATPHLSIKRKSLHGRKLRPKSVVDSVEGLSADDIPSLLPTMPGNSEEEDSVTELPNATYQLQHLVKGRPRRAKTRAPTRPLLRPTPLYPDTNTASADNLVEGLDMFFVRPTPSPPITENASSQAGATLTPTSTHSNLNAAAGDKTDGTVSDDCSSSSGGGVIDGNGGGDVVSPVPSDDSGGGRKTSKLQRNSPQLKGLFIHTPRSRSTDNLERYSPAFIRKETGSESTTPVSRRTTATIGDDSGSICSASHLQSADSSDGSLSQELTMVEQPATEGTDTLSPDTKRVENDLLKSLKLKSVAPIVAPKPRPWSMVNTDSKTPADSDSSTGNSAVNTPDSAVDGKENSDCTTAEISSIDRKVIKESKTKKAGLLQSYFHGRDDFRFLSRKKETTVEQPKVRLLSANSLPRDNNYNCKDSGDLGR